MHSSTRRARFSTARAFAAAGFLFCLALLPARAQVRGPQPTRAVPAEAPPCKIAVINTDAFADERAGVKRLARALRQAGRESERREQELNDLRRSIEQLSNEVQEIARKSGDQAEQATSQKRQELDRMRDDLAQKMEGKEAGVRSYRDELTAPLHEDLRKAMIAYAKARGFTVLLEQSKDKGSVVWAVEAFDITKDFINDYNSKFPADETGTPKP